MAPEAELIFQAIEQTAKWKPEIIKQFESQGKKEPASGLWGIPDNLKQLFQPAYDNGARIHSNSWGGRNPGVYDKKCENLDEFVWTHKDFLIVVAAGNLGKQSLSNIRTIELESITSPGIAKNCLTVGASENNRNGQFPYAYGNWHPESFPYEPFNSEDRMVDSVNDIAAFSGRGFCRSYRKPDVIAPGTFILSTRSSQMPNHDFAWGAYPEAKWHYMYMGGTSMATPLIAGCAALVRQYLRERYQSSMRNPSAAQVKAILIHSAQYINYRFAHPDSAPWADIEQGWGRVDLQQVLNPKDTTNVLFIDKKKGLKTGEKHKYQIEITDNIVSLRITLVYTDYPGECLINNLNLVLHSPSDKYYLGNDFKETGKPDKFNNVEGILIKSPETGLWTVDIVAEVQTEEQDYALVISGGGLRLI